ncbi:hypothetical protein AWV79_25690 [Cupriavidus sp. UYMMa02A]|nr:hypothetical protein AWV79_25690 [Cupriavidus sp. UYMMa02A]
MIQHRAARRVGHGQHHAVHAMAQQVFHTLAFARRIVAAGDQHQRIAVRQRRFLDAVPAFGEHRVFQRRQHHADHAGLLGAQLAAQQVGAKAQPARASRTRCAVLSRTRCGLLNTRDAVASDTRAACATSIRVAPPVMSGLPAAGSLRFTLAAQDETFSLKAEKSGRQDIPSLHCRRTRLADGCLHPVWTAF